MVFCNLHVTSINCFNLFVFNSTPQFLGVLRIPLCEAPHTLPRQYAPPPYQKSCDGKLLLTPDKSFLRSCSSILSSANPITDLISLPLLSSIFLSISLLNISDSLTFIWNSTHWTSEAFCIVESVQSIWKVVLDTYLEIQRWDGYSCKKASAESKRNIPLSPENSWKYCCLCHEQWCFSSWNWLA